MKSNPSVPAFLGHRNVSARGWPLCLALALSLLLIAPLAYAQTTSTIQGTVTDEQGAAIVGAQVTIAEPSLGVSRQATTDSTGLYRVAGLPPGNYSVTIGKSGFSSQKSSDLELLVNRTVALNVTLRVATVASETTVQAAAPLLEPTASSTGGTITPTQISSMPINGRDYLDLMQLVPGVTINKQNATAKSASQYDASSDSTTPVMGERAGNTLFLIDGMPNTDEVSGGAASQFNEDSILEFQVITAGYKAEFGHGSGGVINVISKSGTNQWHGGASFFHRNYKLDTSNTKASNAPFLLRWDPAIQFGGPIKKDKIFFYGSAERIRESRQLNFVYPNGTPDFIIAQQEQYDFRNQTYDTRLRGKLDEQLGNHRLTQQVNWTNTQITNYLPLSDYTSTPSQRYNLDARHLILGFSDTATLGNQADPYLFSAFYQYRGEPSRTQAANPGAGAAYTSLYRFSSYDTGSLLGDLDTVHLGYGGTPTLMDQKYSSAGVSLAKHWGRNNFKFGWDFQHMVVDGTESSFLTNQLFTTDSDLQQYGPNSAGVYLLQTPTPTSAKDSQIRLRNIYNGLFVQDDIKLFKNLTVNAGLRWDRDSRFPTNGNVSPRVGFAWAVTPKTVIRASYGLFYDHFRLGLARDIPDFGGANLTQVTYFSFPRLFYGNPTIMLPLFAYVGYNVPCVASNATDTQIGGGGCPYNPALPYFGNDHLNGIVAPGHAPIPAGAVVDISNVQSLTGLSPQQFADQASAAIGQPQGYFSWDLLGHLGAGNVIGAYQLPTIVDKSFKVPYTAGYQIGIQREFTPTFAVSADYYHRDMRDILGLRVSNLTFASRLDNSRSTTDGTGLPINSFGPWYSGKYDGLIVTGRKVMSRRFTLEASYAWANATDDVIQYTGTGTALPSDSFVGVVPVVSEPTGTINVPNGIYNGQPCGGSNQSGPFRACNENPVPQAGKFYNGPALDKGPSSLSLNHTFQVSGLLDLPWKFQFSSIFRVQSGFPYSRDLNNDSIDVDGDSFFTGIDLRPGRNAFNAPAYTNMDIRVGKRFDFNERIKLNLYFEMFNLFNAANPAAVQTRPDQPLPALPFGAVAEVLPGREGQVGLKFEF
ncbi:MAG: TonB-dependent receptor [Terriglobia bacterium]|jgi:outer membrane receptor protein involved in Fe transport|nr:TonB-dependent receptor [Terriglobia bacterium]